MPIYMTIYPSLFPTNHPLTSFEIDNINQALNRNIAPARQLALAKNFNLFG